MENVINEEEIGGIVSEILADYEGGKNIDAVNIYNKPDKKEMREMVRDLLRIIFPALEAEDANQDEKMHS